MAITCTVTAQDTVKVKQLFHRAETDVASGNTSDAIKVYVDILDLDANNYRAANALAGLYGHLHQYNNQITWAKKALEINPKYGSAYITLGNAYGATANVLQAEENYRIADNLMPNSPYPAYCLGLIEETQGRARDAVLEYKRSIDRDSMFFDGYCGLAVCYATLQDYTTAQKYIDQALTINSSSPKAIEIKRRIEDAIVNH